MTCVGKTNGGGTFPIQPQEENGNIRLAISYVARGSRFRLRGNKRCLWVRFVSWLWADLESIVVLQRHKRLTETNRPPSPPLKELNDK